MKAIVVFFLLLVVVQNTISEKIHTPFNYFILVIDCLRTPDKFIIHGLWPTNSKGPNLRDCYEKKFEPFIVMAYYPIYPNLISIKIVCPLQILV